MNRGDRCELIVMDDADRQRFVDTQLHLAETLSLLRSLSRSVFHDCRSGLLRCTGKATGPVPGLRFIKIRKSFSDSVSPDPSPQGHGVGRPHSKCFQSPIVGLHRNVDLRALWQCSAIRKTNGRNGTG